MNQGGGSSYSNSFCASLAKVKICVTAFVSPSALAIFALNTRSAMLRRLVVGLLPHDRYAAHAAASDLNCACACRLADICFSSANAMAFPHTHIACAIFNEAAGCGSAISSFHFPKRASTSVGVVR